MNPGAAADQPPAEAETAETGQPEAAADGPAPGGFFRVRRREILRVALLLIAIAITLVLIFFRNEFARFSQLGYLGLFILGLVGSATVVLPMPGLALAFAAGSGLTPWLVGLAFGSGAALGEMTGYLAGYGGSAVVPERFYAGRTAALMRSKWGALIVFVLSLIPNPAFDLVGIAAGAMHIRVYYFLAAAWAGNVIKATLVALAGAGAIDVISPILLERLIGE